MKYDYAEYILIYALLLSAIIIPNREIHPESEKQRGIKITGLPLPSYNDDDGFGFGARVYLTNYTEGYEPFKWQFLAQVYKTTKKRENHEFKVDILKFPGTALRVKMKGGFVRYQSAQYYGYGNYQNMRRIENIQEGNIPINENLPPSPDILQLENPLIKEDVTLNENGFLSILSGQTPGSDSLNPGRRILRERQNKYYNYDRVEPYGEISTENWFKDSNFKWWTAYRGVRYRIDSYYKDHDDGEAEQNSRTLLDIERPTGYNATENRQYVNQFRFALVYDSRPRLRENDPNSGIFADAHIAVSDKSIGSHYNYKKLTLTYRQYIEMLPGFFQSNNQELVFSYRLQGQQTFGDAPFFEMNRILTKEEESEGLGGTTGLRGYPSNQFVDRIMGMGNVELRWTFSKKPWLGGMNWVLLTYFDLGRVSENRQDMDMTGWHKAWGGGIRLVWQTNTVINISQGFSKERSFLAFSFGHMF